LRSLQRKSAQALCENLWDETIAFCQPNLQQDDFTLVCVKWF
jgi:serine phosphatase RsbU (regulator of sigma subunit)